MADVREAYEEGKRNFGARRIKDTLTGKGMLMSRRKIGRLMAELGLVSIYGMPKYTKPGTKDTKSGRSAVSNLFSRQFSGWSENDVIVSDLTYVRASRKWCHVRTLIDLFNQKVVGWSAGENKGADLILRAFAMSGIDWMRAMTLHADRGMEFCTTKIDEFLDRHGIIRSLSRPGTPIDNAVAESFYKTVKKEFVRKREFSSLENLKLLFGDWLHWYNN